MSGSTNIGYLRILDSLNDFLPESKRDESIKISFDLNPSVKDVIEAHGIPHVEIFGTKINGRWEDLSYNLRYNDRILVYPKERISASGESHALKPPDRMPDRFIADVHLGKLVRLLRLIGIDTEYDKKLKDKAIVKRAEETGRAVLSRDVGLLKHGNLSYGYWLRSTDPDKQILEVLSYFDLAGSLNPFSRCLVCNGPLKFAEPNDVINEVPEGVKSWSEEYRRCQDCEKIYWKGSHFRDLQEKVKSIRGALK